MRLNSKYTTEKFCPKTFSAKQNVRFAGIMSDNSDQKILDEPEFVSIRHQAMAFERMFDMSANFESYADHVQHFPERVKDFARGGRSPQGLDEWFDEPTSEHSDGFIGPQC